MTNTLADGLIERTSSMIDEIASEPKQKDEERRSIEEKELRH